MCPAVGNAAASESNNLCRIRIQRYVEKGMRYRRCFALRRVYRYAPSIGVAFFPLPIAVHAPCCHTCYVLWQPFGDECFIDGLDGSVTNHHFQRFIGYTFSSGATGSHQWAFPMRLVAKNGTWVRHSLHNPL